MATRNFTDLELECRCKCGALPSDLFQFELQALRDEYGKPMPLTSCKRCSAHNINESSTGPNGPHVWGAFDAGVGRENVHDLVAAMIRRGGWNGIGVQGKGARRFVHGDRRPFAIRRFWTY